MLNNILPNTLCYRASQWRLGFDILWQSQVKPTSYRKSSKDCCGPQSKTFRAILVSNNSTQNKFAGPLKHVLGRSCIPIQSETLCILLLLFTVLLSHFGHMPGYHLIWSHSCCLLCQGLTDFLIYKSRSHLKIMDARRVACSNFYPEDPQIFSTTEQNLVAMANWRPGFVHPCSMSFSTRYSPIMRTFNVVYSALLSLTG